MFINLVRHIVRSATSDASSLIIVRTVQVDLPLPREPLVDALLCDVEVYNDAFAVILKCSLYSRRNNLISIPYRFEASKCEVARRVVVTCQEGFEGDQAAPEYSVVVGGGGPAGQEQCLAGVPGPCRGLPNPL